MAVKIRLQRHGRKKKPFYWIVAADSRTKRDGRFLEKIGTYNPILDTCEVNLSVDSAVKWLQNGAVPTTTVRRLLSREGVLLRNHLEIGIVKGAITKEEAEKRFKSWLADKERRKTKKIEKKKEKAKMALQSEQEEAKKVAQEKLETEKKNKEQTIVQSDSSMVDDKKHCDPEAESNEAEEKQGERDSDQKSEESTLDPKEGNSKTE